MKTFIKILVLTLIIVSSAYSQWQPDFRLTNNAALSSTTGYNNERCIASSGDTVHVVWKDNRDGGNYEIYYKRSTDGGISWGSDTRISNNIYFSTNPSVSISGSVVHVVWDDNRDGNYEIYYNRSTNGGTSWGTDTRLTNDPAASETPCVSASGSVVYVVWDDNRVAFIGAYYKRSTDGGLSWGTDTRLTNDSAAALWSPSVSASGSVVHFVGLSGHNGNQDVFYKRSSDGGLNWEADTWLTNDTVIKNNPSASISGSVVYVIWLDSRDRYPNYEIYYKRSTDGGISWGADTRLTTNYTSATLFSTISVSGPDVHVVWDDNRNGNYEIYYKRSTDGGLSWGTDTRLTNNSAVSAYPFISASGSVVHVVWMDNRDGNNEIYYKRDPTGNPVSSFQSQYNHYNINKLILDNQNTFDTITVDFSLSLANYYVYDVNLKIDTVIHTNDSDLEFYLIHNGVTDTAIYQVGGSGDNFINTILNDSAATTIASGTAPFNGSYKPHKPLSQFNGYGINGTWILKIYDRATGNTGTLKAWSLNFLIGTNPIGIQNISNEIPNGFSLSQNYPNPFNPKTKIRFTIGSNVKSETSNTKIIIFDILGREIATLVNERLQPGTYEVDWDASQFSSGVYFYTLVVGDALALFSTKFSETKRMVLIK